MLMKKYKYIAFNKPFGVLCQFTGEENDKTLADFNFPKDVYAAGRLDKDSEGLLILTNDGVFNQKLTNPKSQKEKIYHVQVEGIPSPESLKKFQNGLMIKDYITKPCKVEKLDDYIVEERDPPIRKRKNIPTTWLKITITEGKNRQVRRMTAKIGHPTLRLIRQSVGKFELENIEIGQWVEVDRNDIL